MSSMKEMKTRVHYFQITKTIIFIFMIGDVIMNEENKKLENALKSCKAVKICTTIMFAFLIVAACLTLISGITLFVGKEKFDIEIENALKNGSMKTDISIGSIKIGRIDGDDVKLADGLSLESSVPALNDFFAANRNSLSLIISAYCLLAFLICAIMAVALGFVTSGFNTILKEGNPFADPVPKKILVAMIIVSCVIGSLTGIGFAVLMGLLTWAIYTILDYGRYLRVQSDETL